MLQKISTESKNL